ncbi:MAG TPA: peptidylprolyl isomerase [Kofleriaceae bacterium]|jgi:hypothetical protein
MKLALVFVLVAACGPGSPGGPTMNSHMSSENVAPVSSSVESADIMAREPLANTATVKHILVGWKDLAEQYNGHMDPRAEKRTKAEAEAEVRSLVGQLKAGADFDTLMKQYSEDTGSASTARAYTVTPGAELVVEFRNLSLRLNVGEVGVIQSDYGFHIIKRLD